MHTSARVTDDGQFISGLPIGFIVYADPGVRVYHAGDTAIYSDLNLVVELKRPNIGLIGVGLPPAEFLEAHGYIGLHGNEMTADEAALDARWLGLEYALAIQYFKAAGNPDVERFTTILNNLHSDDSPVVKPIILEAGVVFVEPPEAM
jgi:L-ascorbate metabolism protein UlaG (beta-lactamase superfamily)